MTPWNSSMNGCFVAGVAYARIGTPRAGLFERLMRLTLARKT